MKLSTKGRYGLRAVLDLAMFYGKAHVSVNQIAFRQGLSVQYLEQMFSTLRKAGIVRSVKGAGGGYTLSDSPEMLTVGSVLRVLEGDLSIVRELQRQEEQGVNALELTIRELVWQPIDERTHEILESVTLQDLAMAAEKKEVAECLNFYI